MKFRKSLIAAMLTGAGVIAVAPAINAAEYSTSVSGNIRVEGTTVTEGGITTSSTKFGGDDDEANTGGDTFLQWNHNFANDEGTTTGGGFLRFTGDGDVRINVHATSELGNYKGELKAEWEQEGLTGKINTNRDQFAKLTNVPSGVYYKIGREQWLDNNKGYTSDFLAQTEGMAWVSGENRFAAHALGWSGNGVDVALLIQRDNSGLSSARPSGQDIEGITTPAVPEGQPAGTKWDTQIADVSGFGLLLSYDGGDSTPFQADLNIGSGELKNNPSRKVALVDKDGEAIEGVASVASTDDSADTSFTQLHMAFPVSGGKYVPFINYGASSQKYKIDKRKDISLSGWNLGASIGLGASDLIVAYGTQTETVGTSSTIDIGGIDITVPSIGTTNSGFDLIWATNQEPLKVSLAYSSVTAKSQYGVRLDFGF